MGQHRRPRRRPSVGLGPAVLSLCLATAPAAPLDPTMSPHDFAPTAVAFPCRGYQPLGRFNPVESVRRDVFAWAGHTGVRVGDGRGDVDWSTNPTGLHIASMWLQSLVWIGALIESPSPSDRDHAVSIVRDWAADHPFPWSDRPAAWEPTMHRTRVLLCLRARLTGPAGAPVWLDDVVTDHLRFMDRYWSGEANHGTEESVMMLTAACTLGRPSYVTLARNRLADSLDRAVDAQGATNEQSIGYANMNHTLWGTAAAALRRCGIDARLSRRIEQRRAALARFIAHATTPRGTLVPLGDTVGALRPTPAAAASLRQRHPAVAVYHRGYVFGRSRGIGPAPTDDTFYSLRFGPPRRWHGHDDHMSLTLQALGRDILVDPSYGHPPGDDMTDDPAGASAHNAVTVPGMRRGGSQTTLTSHRIRKDSQTFTMADSPAPGVTRRRSVFVSFNPDVVVVRDVLGSRHRTTFTQHWHLPPGTRVHRDRQGQWAVAPDRRDATLFAVVDPPALGGRAASATPPASGTPRTVQVWVWRDWFHRSPSPVLQRAVDGRSADITTVIVPRRAGHSVRIERRGSVVVVHVDDRRATIRPW